MRRSEEALTNETLSKNLVTNAVGLAVTSPRNGPNQIHTMKVLVIAQRFPPDMSGSCTRAWNVVKELEKLGHELVVVAAFPRDPWANATKSNKAFKCEQSGVKLFRVWVPPLYYAGFGDRLLLHISFVLSSLFPLFLVGKVDVVWAANPNFFSMFPAIIYSLVYRVPIVRNVDDLWPEAVYDLGYIKSRLLRKLLDFASKITYVIPKAITPISNSYKEAITRHYGIHGNKIFVIEHGVDLSVSHPLMVENNYDGGSFVVMYSGKLGIAYDFDVVLKAARKLSSFNDIKFVIRGFGEQIDEIRNKIAKYEVSNVILDTTFVDKGRLTGIQNSAHVFILPMKPLKAPERGLPTKILEYQACGKPIICCSEGEPARYVNFTKSGLVVRPGDSEALANAILRLYRDKKLRGELGTNGWSHVSQHLTCKKIGERMYRVFSEVIESEGIK
jgi:glycosyltransferase involved in cell wall biosynthesis